MEICNGIDDDCDGSVDEDPLLTWYADADSDGYGDANRSLRSCTAPVGYVANSEDCNDADSTAHHVPVEVRVLSLEITRAGVLLSWDSQNLTAGDGTVYEVVTGFQSDLQEDAEFRRSACLVAALPINTYEDTRSAPPANDGFYYLVRARNSCGIASFGDSSIVPDVREQLDTSGGCGRRSTPSRKRVLQRDRRRQEWPGP
jgi:hypothetical protein